MSEEAPGARRAEHPPQDDHEKAPAAAQVETSEGIVGGPTEGDKAAAQAAKERAEKSAQKNAGGGGTSSGGSHGGHSAHSHGGGFVGNFFLGLASLWQTTLHLIREMGKKFAEKGGGGGSSHKPAAAHAGGDHGHH